MRKVRRCIAQAPVCPCRCWESLAVYSTAYLGLVWRNFRPHQGISEIDQGLCVACRDLQTVLPRLSSHERKADAERLRRSFESQRCQSGSETHLRRVDVSEIPHPTSFPPLLGPYRRPCRSWKVHLWCETLTFLYISWSSNVVLVMTQMTEFCDTVQLCTIHPGEIDTNRLWALCCFGFRLSAEPKMPGDHAANAPTLCFSGFVLRILSGLCHNCLQTEEAKLYIVYILYM